MLLSYSFFAHLPPGGSCNQMSMLALAAVAPKLMCAVFTLQLLQCGFIFHRKRFAKAQKTSQGNTKPVSYTKDVTYYPNKSAMTDQTPIRLKSDRNKLRGPPLLILHFLFLFFLDSLTLPSCQQEQASIADFEHQTQTSCLLPCSKKKLEIIKRAKDRAQKK